MQSLYFLLNFLNFLFTCLLSFFFLPEAIFYKIYIVYRDVITVDLWVSKLYHHISFGEAFVGEI